MKKFNNIFLVGLMGAGKTTIGRYLAKKLHKDFIDSDHEIEKSAGSTIPCIFENEGEIGFRQREQAIIAKLTEQSNIILSTGGGVVLNVDNCKYLQSCGYVIYLRASVNDLVTRTAQSRNRPLLKTNPREKLSRLFKERHLLYQAVADVTIETGGRSIRQVVAIVLKHLNNR
jgi:shikimate kinase